MTQFQDQVNQYEQMISQLREQNEAQIQSQQQLVAKH